MAELREMFSMPFCDAVAKARENQNALIAGAPVATATQTSTAVPDKKTAEQIAHEAEWTEVIRAKFHRDA